jgi:hypothetical protein
MPKCRRPRIFTALVPLTKVASVLQSVGGIGHGVNSRPGQPVYAIDFTVGWSFGETSQWGSVVAPMDHSMLTLGVRL